MKKISIRLCRLISIFLILVGLCYLGSTKSYATEGNTAKNKYTLGNQIYAKEQTNTINPTVIENNEKEENTGNSGNAGNPEEPKEDEDFGDDGDESGDNDNVNEEEPGKDDNEQKPDNNGTNEGNTNNDNIKDEASGNENQKPEQPKENTQTSNEEKISGISSEKAKMTLPFAGNTFNILIIAITIISINLIIVYLKYRNIKQIK